MIIYKIIRNRKVIHKDNETEDQRVLRTETDAKPDKEQKEK